MALRSPISPAKENDPRPRIYRSAHALRSSLKRVAAGQPALVNVVTDWRARDDGAVYAVFDLRVRPHKRVLGRRQGTDAGFSANTERESAHLGTCSCRQERTITLSANGRTFLENFGLNTLHSTIFSIVYSLP